MSDHSILLIDDEEILRKALSAGLEEKGYRVATAANGPEGIEKFKTHNHDLVIVDLIMEGANGLQVTKEIRKIHPDASVIILTGHGTLESAIDALRLRIQDYILKPIKLEDLLAKIQTCLNSKFNGHKTADKAPSYSQNLKIENASLTRRQKEVARLVSRGYNDEEIAKLLGISIFTVRFHLKKAFKKLNIHKRVELILSSND